MEVVGKIMMFSVSDVYTQEIVFTGTAKQCREHFGVADTTFREAASKGSLMRRRYVVDQVNAEEMDNSETVPNGEAARKLDEFCAPIREKYGIPVHRPEVEVSE